MKEYDIVESIYNTRVLIALAFELGRSIVKAFSSSDIIGLFPLGEGSPSSSDGAVRNKTQSWQFVDTIPFLSDAQIRGCNHAENSVKKEKLKCFLQRKHHDELTQLL